MTTKQLPTRGSMSWHIGLTKHATQIGKWYVYSTVQKDGSTRYFTGGQFLEYTLDHDDDGEMDIDRFIANYRRCKISDDGDGCPVCGRPVVERTAKAVYCGVSCYNTAKWRRGNERKKSA